jgi:hypothetical protein
MKKSQIVTTLILCFCIAVILPLASFAMPNFWKLSNESFETEATVSLSSFFERGNGSAQTPFVIHEPKHMVNLAKLVAVGYLMNPYFYEICGNCVNGSFTVIDMTGLPIPPIGSAEYPFTGYFNGRGREGKIVANATIVSGRPDGINEYDDIGFFGFVGPGALVRDLILDNPRIVSGTFTERGLLDALTPSYSLQILNNAITLTASTTGDEFYTLHSSDRFNLPISTSESGVQTASPFTSVRGRVFLHVNLNKADTATGLIVSKALGGYLVEIANQQIIQFESYTNIERRGDHKYIGLAVGHVAGTIEDVSVYGGSIETNYHGQGNFKTHSSQFGTIGFVDTLLVSIGFLNGDSQFLDEGDVGYLHPDGLNARIGDSMRYYEAGGYQTANYLTQGGFATPRTGGGWNFRQNNDLPGFGIFRILTDESSATQIQPVGTPVTSFRFYDTSTLAGGIQYFNNGYLGNNAGNTQGVPFDLNLDYTGNATLESLRANLIDPFRGGAQRLIRQFDFALRFTQRGGNNPQSVPLVHPFTGATTGQTTRGMIPSALQFTTSRADVRIIVVARSGVASNSQIVLSRVVQSGNNFGTNPIQVLRLPADQSAVACIFQLPQAGTYTISNTSQQGNSNIQTSPDGQLLYVAVEGQNDGESGSIDAGVVSTVDFVYSENGVIIPVTHGSYVYSMISMRFEWTADGGKVYYRRFGAVSHIDIYYNGDSADFNKEGGAGTYAIHHGGPP